MRHFYVAQRHIRNVAVYEDEQQIHDDGDKNACFSFCKVDDHIDAHVYFPFVRSRRSEKNAPHKTACSNFFRPKDSRFQKITRKHVDDDEHRRRYEKSSRADFFKIIKKFFYFFHFDIRKSRNAGESFAAHPRFGR